MMSGVDGSSDVDFARGGRGARQRILATARMLFYRDGINATSVDALIDRAHVSKRTFYQYFATKDELVEVYLRDLDTSGAIALEQGIYDTTRSAQDRILAMFEGVPQPRIRGCPFHNAAVEAAERMPQVHAIIHQHKLRFIDDLAQVCAQTGTSDPIRLAHQIATLFEGALALATTLNDTAPMLHARSVAEILLDTNTQGSPAAGLRMAGGSAPA